MFIIYLNFERILLWKSIWDKYGGADVCWKQKKWTKTKAEWPDLCIEFLIKCTNLKQNISLNRKTIQIKLLGYQWLPLISSSGWQIAKMARRNGKYLHLQFIYISLSLSLSARVSIWASCTQTDINGCCCKQKRKKKNIKAMQTQLNRCAGAMSVVGGKTNGRQVAAST